MNRQQRRALGKMLGGSRRERQVVARSLQGDTPEAKAKRQDELRKARQWAMGVSLGDAPGGNHDEDPRARPRATDQGDGGRGDV